MKFAAIVSSALTLTSVFAAPAPQADQVQVNNVPGGIAYPANFDLNKYINADSIYNIIQEISKVPKDKFTSNVNKAIDYAQDVVDVTLALESFFEDKFEHLTAEQLEKLGKLWTEVLGEIEKFPTDLHKLEAELGSDLLDLAVILFELEDWETLLHLSELFKR